MSMSKFFGYLAILLLGISIAGCAGTSSIARTCVLKSDTISFGSWEASLTRYKDDKDCPEDSFLVIKKDGKGVDQRKLEAGVEPVFMKVDGKPVLFVQYMGGNGAGWGLYRYMPEQRRLNYFDFNAWELKKIREANGGVEIGYAYEWRNEKAKLIGTKVKKWMWRNDEDRPHLMQTRSFRK